MKKKILVLMCDNLIFIAFAPDGQVGRKNKKEGEKKMKNHLLRH